MSHEIMPHDAVLSDTSPEWHGLARVVSPITRTSPEVRPLLFPIITLPEISGEVDGERITLTGYKALVADIRDRNGSQPFVPLAIHSDAYEGIPYGDVWEAVATAAEPHDVKIRTVGTLGNLRRFFMSLDLGGQNSGFDISGDKFLAFLNVVTSHDGSLALQAYDSNVRIVCRNTLNASMFAQGGFRIHVKHTAGAKVEVTNFGRLIEATLDNRRRFVEAIQPLQEMPVTPDDARAMIAGWKFIQQDSPIAFGTPTRNAIKEMSRLFSEGRGTHGRTAYDLWNGVTEYYSTGRGAGITTTQAKRTTSALFGTAASMKVDFTRRLIDDDRRHELLEVGKSAVLLA